MRPQILLGVMLQLTLSIHTSDMVIQIVVAKQSGGLDNQAVVPIFFLGKMEVRESRVFLYDAGLGYVKDYTS